MQAGATRAERFGWLAAPLVGVVVIAGLWLTVTPDEERWTQVVVAAVGLAGAVLSRWAPVPGAALALVATVIGWVFGLTVDPFVLAAIAVFAVARRHGRRRCPWWLIAITAVTAAVMLLGGGDALEDRLRALLLSAIVLGGSWAFGVQTREAAAQAAQRSRNDDRLRLARDVHDVLSHALGAVGARAGIAAHLTALGEPALRETLRSIETQSSDALNGLRGVLWAERVEAAYSGVRTVPSLPLGAALRTVAANAEAAGVAATVDLDPAIDSLPAAVRTTVHRVVQEAVANTIRHASASAVTVTVRIAGQDCIVEVHDDGTTREGDVVEGDGLTDIRERVELLDGTVRAGRTPDGFVVSAWLPGSDGR